MDEEFAERQYAKMEMQINQAQNNLKGLTQQQREWFQTMKQRKEEKERLSINTSETNSKDGKKKFTESNKKREKREKEQKKHPNQLAKERAIREIQQASLVRAKMSKFKNKLPRLNAVQEDQTPQKAVSKKRKSKFALDLTDTSRRGAKRLR